MVNTRTEYQPLIVVTNDEVEAAREDETIKEFFAFAEQYARKVRESGRDHTRSAAA
jgi:head-tail adaptor